VNPEEITMARFSFISPDTLAEWLNGNSSTREIAVLDLRDEAAYGYGEPLTGTNVPPAQLETRVAQVLPRRSTRTVLVDDDGSRSEAAVQRLAALGYSDLHVLRGGLNAWTASGRAGTLHPQARVFTQQVSRDKRTPVSTAQELARLRREGHDVVVLDTRTPEEFARGHVPGAISVPGAELVYRFADLVPSPDTVVLTSCAGLPRAVIGAQILIDAGVPNPVSLLEDGTKGWQREGWDLELGAARSYGPLSDAALLVARDRAEHLREHTPVPFVDAAQIDIWQQDTDRTTYLLDVRTAEEFAAGHVEGALHAPGGQLQLNAHRFAAARGARLVLLDDHGVRATTTAHWLRQRGWEVWWHPVPEATAVTRGEQAALAA
jgi:rhodanese-related sulfurtransferase